jgi:hypothetical protein
VDDAWAPGRRFVAAAIVVLAFVSSANLAAEATTDTAPAQKEPAPGDSPPPVSSPRTWEFSVAGNGYLFPGEGDFLLGIVTADRGPLHLETRYNYEDRNTTSLWAGWNWSTGQTVEFEITPMLGVVFGDTDGIAPGFELSLAWKRLDYYIESEVVFDRQEHTDNFIYSWSELGLSPVDWLRFGLVGQRTRVYETGLDIQRGVFAQAILGGVTIGVDWFNPGSDDYFTVAILEYEF